MSASQASAEGVVVILGSQSWHNTDAVQRARDELFAAHRLWQQMRPASGCISFTDDQQAACERTVWAELVYAAAVNAALRVQLLT